MRPLRLYMTAFGTFAETTKVDFERVNKGLYLVTGDTGAGKTTIFDAIVFALFGELSGSNRSADMMHCDHVSRKIDTVVELWFEHQGKEHHVKRTLHYSQKRGLQGEDAYQGKPAMEAEFWEEGQKVIEKSGRVTDRIEEILGLNCGQFCQIVMLAQGEFRKFLDSDSKSREEILRRLFDTLPYQKVQKYLAEASRKLEEERRDATQQLKQLMEVYFQLPEGLSEEDKAAYSYVRTDLSETLTALVQADETCAEQLGQEKQTREDVFQALDRQLTLATGQNRLLEDLEKAQDRKAELDARAEEQAIRREQLKQAEKAFYKVLPVQRDVIRKKNGLQELRNAALQLASTRDAAEETVEQAERTLMEARKTEGRIAELSHQAVSLGESLPLYEEAEKQEQELREVLKKQSQLQTEDRALREEKETRKDSRGQLEQELQELQNAERVYFDAEKALDEARKRFQDGMMDQKTGLRPLMHRGYDAAAKTEKIAAHASNQLRKAYDLEMEFSRMNMIFLADQAGILGKQLTDDVHFHGEGTCPVCRTKFRVIPLDGFAKPSEDTVTKAQLDAKDAERKKAADERERASAALVAARQEEEQCKKLAVDRYAAIFGVELSFEELDAGGALEKAEERLRQEMENAQKAFTLAENDQIRKQTLLERVKTVDERLVEIDNRLAELARDLSEVDICAAKLQASITEKKKGLRYASAQEAYGVQRKLEQERDELKQALEQAQTNAESCRAALEVAKANCISTADRIREEEESSALLEATFARVLGEEGFDTMEAYEAILQLMQGQKEDDWISARRQELETYERACQQTAADLERLTKDTEGLSYVNLEELNEQANAAKQAKTEAEEQLQQAQLRLSNHRTTREQAAEIRRRLAESDAASRRLRRMSDYANGSLTMKGGKLSFERYVMGAYFRDVLESANKRLDVMSGGRYELVHQSGGESANSAAGLGIEVLDHYTEKQRKTGSFSGGESFHASMALALGLSDVVQSQSGGQQMDAMFIDEGFGSLSSEALNQAMAVLQELAGGKRQIGIISHVETLRGCVPSKILVKNHGDGKGSFIEYE